MEEGIVISKCMIAHQATETQNQHSSKDYITEVITPVTWNWVYMIVMCVGIYSSTTCRKAGLIAGHLQIVVEMC